MKRVLPISLGITLLILLGLAFISQNKVTNVSAASATHVVISEVQVAGALPTDDFIELYNPTESEIDLKDYRLVKVTGSGTDDDSVVAFEDGDVIPAHGYFLWCNTNLSVTLSCDSSTGSSIANNNSVGIRNGALNTGILVDSVTFGNVDNPLGEGSFLTALSASNSVERKANSTSTDLTMGIGGLDEFLGNAEDTDNNLSDFILRTIPQAQNATSALEPIETSPSPTDEPSLTPTLEPTATPSPTEDPSPTPTQEPSPTPTAEPSPTTEPSQAPSVSPTVTPIVTQMPSPTPSPIISPVPPTPTPKVIAQGPIFTCTLTYKPWRLFNKTYYFPSLGCVRTSI